MKYYIEKCLRREDLTVEEASEAMQTIMDGAATEAQVAGMIVALRAKGETVDEIVGFARTMRKNGGRIIVQDPNAIDLCGTGGDGSNTFNISTVASFVAAGAGVTIVKHGNRSVSSTCGSADLLATLGVKLDVSIPRVEQCVNEIGIGFLFAPLFHPAMKYAAKPRVELGIKSIFNMLGPITNPGNVKKQVIGVYDLAVAEKIAEAVRQLGSVHVCVLCNEERVDEVLLSAPTVVYEMKYGEEMRQYRVDAETFGLPSSSLADVKTTSKEQNAEITLQVLGGIDSPASHTVVANAAMGIYVAGKASNLKDAVTLAQESIASGSALRKLQLLKEYTALS
jgi:anthranilate phosphoribosyltransferase